jgi:hypothetical protein
MKHKSTYQTIYRLNEESKAYMIEVSLDDYAEIFNGWDASPLKRKDMEPELVDYLEQAGEEIARKEKVEICFYLSSDRTDLDKEQKSLLGIKNHLKVIMSFINKKLNRLYRQIITYFILSTTFVTTAYLLRGQAENSLLFVIMVEGLFIGGWFMLWEAFSTFVFDSHETRTRRRIFQRFIHANIYFKDTMS